MNFIGFVQRRSTTDVSYVLDLPCERNSVKSSQSIIIIIVLSSYHGAEAGSLEL